MDRQAVFEIKTQWVRQATVRPLRHRRPTFLTCGPQKKLIKNRGTHH